MIPVNQPLLDGEEAALLRECIETGWISSEGPFISKFEDAFAARVGRRFGVAVANGTAALEIAVAALDLQQGDEVIVPTFTIISCVAAIVRAGAVPILVDADPETWNMRAEDVEAKLTLRTRAVMVVHIYGLPVDLDPILALAAKHGLSVIEDAAEMHGQTYKGRPCGSFGDVSTFSFYPNKVVTTGEGGILVTDRTDLADAARSLRNLCFQAGRRFVHERLGWNYRMTNLQAALGLAQLNRLDEFVGRKRAMGVRYSAALRSMGRSIRLPLARTAYAENIYWVYGIVLDESVPFDAAEAMARLATRGVACRPFFWPMHEQPVFMRAGLFRGERYPVSERIARRGLYVPSGLALTESQIDQVANVVTEELGAASMPAMPLKRLR